MTIKKQQTKQKIKQKKSSVDRGQIENFTQRLMITSKAEKKYQKKSATKKKR